MTGCETLRSRLRSRLLWLALPLATEWQRIGKQINAASIFARADFVNVL
jgi:hypothetical protein